MWTDRRDGGDYAGPSLCGRGSGSDSGMHRLPLPAAGGHDHPLCQSHHGPLQRHPHLHLGGAASRRLAEAGAPSPGRRVQVHPLKAHHLRSLQTLKLPTASKLGSRPTRTIQYHAAHLRGCSQSSYRQEESPRIIPHT